MCGINGGRVSSGGGRSGEVEALITSDGAVWTWAQVLEEFGPAVRSYGRSRGVTDVDDLVQDVFTAVVQNVPTFRGTSADLRSFVFTIAFRRIADRHRRAYRRQGLRREPMPVEQPDESVLHHDDGARAIAALGRLDERSQAVLRLRYIDGHDVAEVAELMNLSATNVRAIQSRALKRLRARFAGRAAGVHQGSLVVLASASAAARRCLGPAARALRSVASAVRRVWEPIVSGVLGIGQPGVGAAGGASLVAVASITAASILGSGGPTAAEHVAPVEVVVPLRTPSAVGPTSEVPMVPVEGQPAPGPPEPQLTPLPTEPVGAGLPVPAADAPDDTTGQPAAVEAAPPPDQQAVAQATGASGLGSLGDRLSAPDLVDVPVEVVDVIGPDPLAGPTDALAAVVAAAPTPPPAAPTAIDLPVAENVLPLPGPEGSDGPSVHLAGVTRPERLAELELLQLPGRRAG